MWIRLTLRWSQGVGRATHLKMPGSAGGGGDKVAGAKDFEIALDLEVHPRAVNDRVAGAVGRHLSAENGLRMM